MTTTHEAPRRARQWAARARRVLPVAGLLAVLTALWVYGAVGKALVRWAVPLWLPHRPSEALALDALRYGPAPTDIAYGVQLSVHPDRAMTILRRAVPGGRWLPPGMLHDDMTLVGRLNPGALGWSMDGAIPVRVVISAHAGYRPRLTVRFPADALNRILDRDIGDALSSEDDYFLGEFAIVYRPRFTTLAVYTDPRPEARSALHRDIYFDAVGDVQIRFVQDFARVTLDGRVRRLDGVLEIAIRHHPDGLGFDHRLRADTLDLDIRNARRAIDRPVARALRTAIERSINRSGMRRQVSALRIPFWFPTDIEIDATLTP